MRQNFNKLDCCFVFMGEKRTYMHFSDKGITELRLFLRSLWNEVAASSIVVCLFHELEAPIHVFSHRITEFRVFLRILCNEIVTSSAVFFPTWARSTHTCILVTAALLNFMYFYDFYMPRMLHPI